MRRLMCLGMFVLLGPLQAEPGQTESVISLDQALIRVLESNPELQGASYKSQAAVARIRAAQQSPAMSVNIGLENFAGSGRLNGSQSLESTLSLSKIFELGSKSERRGEVASQQSFLLESKQDARRLDILATTAKHFIHASTNQAELQLSHDKLKLLQRSYKVVEKRVKAGRSPVAERRRVAIAIARAEIELEHAEHKLKTSKLRLATMWGSYRVNFSAVTGDLYALQAIEPFTQFEQWLDRNPDLVQFATEQRLAQARINLAQSKASADVEFTAGVRHFNTNNDGAFVMEARIPFGLSSRAAPLIEEQQQLSQQVAYRFEQQKLSLYSSLYEIYQELTHSYQAVALFRSRILPEARKALKEYEKGYAAGRYSFLQLIDAQQTLLDARLEVVTNAANYHRYRIEIDRLTGARLQTGVKP
ncbi:hypothetical protein MNBD_GAMMA21-2933 [hydrothermal vent metagenome]|uniref:Heavy metal RND efflux outer membrane protein, CzcC family n=1 Tax=hydrothermal vent metagenome TaxID=652676 RepID=A0A3B1A5U0_9ZZZZ